MTTERNRTVARFTHHGQNYTIHERTNPLSDGTPCTRRFILDESGSHRGEANNVKAARALLDAKRKANR